MARTQKTLSKQNLSKMPVLITDTGPESSYFNIKQLSGVFAGGKNAFLITGTPLLKPNTEVFVEMLDTNGNSLYVEAIKGFVEAKSRLVVIEVYEDTPAGTAILSVVGTAVKTREGRLLSAKETSSPNVRWEKKIIIEPRNKNITPLRLKTTPELFVEESRTNVVNVVQVNNTQTNTYTLTPQIKNAKQRGYTIASSFSALYLNPKITGSFTIEKRKYTYTIPATTPSYEVLQTDTASVDLPLSMLNSRKAMTDTNIVGNLSNSIINIKTLKSGAYTLDEAIQTGSNGNTATQIQSIITSSVVFNYDQVSIYESLPEIESYFKVKLVNLGTVSGQISRIKTSFKLSNATNEDEYTFVADSPLIVAEMLVTGSTIVYSSIRDRWIGEFSDTVFTLRDNWYGHVLTGSSTPNPAYYTSSVSTSTQLTLFPRSNLILAGAFVSGSPNNCFFGSKDSFQVFPTSEYTLKFTAVATASSQPDVFSDMVLDVYAVGTAVVYSDPLGQKIGTVTAKNANIAYFPDVQFNFTVPIEGEIGLRFIPRSGYWQYSYISMKVAEETGFSPDETVFYIPNKIVEDSIIVARAELYDINNNAFDSLILSAPTYFTGSRRYVLRSGDTMSGRLDAQAGITVTGSTYIASGSDVYRWGHKLFNYGQWYSTASQAFTVANTPYSASVTSTAFARGIDVVNGSRFVVENDGHYNLQFSAQLDNTVNNTIVFDIWFAKDQQNITNSATKVEVTKQSGTTGKTVAAWNFMEYLTAGSYMEIRIAANQTSGQLLYEPANGVHPGVPSLIVTMDQIA
jgi:hypothetical protein